jgi:hypothetical protein
MIFIYNKSFSQSDKQSMLMILSHVGITESECVFVDLTTEDVSVDLASRNFIIAFKTYREIARSLVSAGLFKIGDLIGKDVYDEVGKFGLINIPFDMVEALSKDEVKIAIWEKLKTFSAFYKENKAVAKEAVQLELFEPDDDLSVIGVQEKETAVQPDAKDAAKEKTVTIDVPVLMARISEAIDLSDASLGKSLSLSSKIEFVTPTGMLTVYPTNRIPSANEGASMSFKDSLALLRLADAVSATKITFFNE